MNVTGKKLPERATRNYLLSFLIVMLTLRLSRWACFPIQKSQLKILKYL